MKNLIQKQLRERFFVTPRAGINFSGVLIDQDRVHYVFADVTAHPADSEPIKANSGELFIERANVAYLQRFNPNADS